MGMVEEVLVALNKIPAWKRVSATPERLDELEARVRTLEERLSGRGDMCPKCKKLTYELVETKEDPMTGSLGGRRDMFRCTNCDHKDEVLRMP